MYGPLLAVAVLSLFDVNLTTRPPEWVGTANYAEGFARPDAARALWNTLGYLVAILPLSVVAPALAAIAAWRRCCAR